MISRVCGMETAEFDPIGSYTIKCNSRTNVHVYVDIENMGTSYVNRFLSGIEDIVSKLIIVGGLPRMEEHISSCVNESLLNKCEFISHDVIGKVPNASDYIIIGELMKRVSNPSPNKYNVIISNDKIFLPFDSTPNTIILNKNSNGFVDIRKNRYAVIGKVGKYIGYISAHREAFIKKFTNDLMSTMKSLSECIDHDCCVLPTCAYAPKDWDESSSSLVASFVFIMLSLGLSVESIQKSAVMFMSILISKSAIKGIGKNLGITLDISAKAKLTSMCSEYSGIFDNEFVENQYSCVGFRFSPYVYVE